MITNDEFDKKWHEIWRNFRDRVVSYNDIYMSCYYLNSHNIEKSVILEGPKGNFLYSNEKPFQQSKEIMNVLFIECLHGCIRGIIELLEGAITLEKIINNNLPIGSYDKELYKIRENRGLGHEKKMLHFEKTISKNGLLSKHIGDNLKNWIIIRNKIEHWGSILDNDIALYYEDLKQQIIKNIAYTNQESFSCVIKKGPIRHDLRILKIIFNDITFYQMYVMKYLKSLLV